MEHSRIFLRYIGTPRSKRRFYLWKNHLHLLIRFLTKVESKEKGIIKTPTSVDFVQRRRLSYSSGNGMRLLHKPKKEMLWSGAFRGKS